MMQKKSPSQLNEEGERIFEELGGASFLEANGLRLMDEMEQKKPKLPSMSNCSREVCCLIH